MRKYSTLSLFSGCGGLDLGFHGNFQFLNKKYASNCQVPPDYKLIY
jgi:DNA (cytosine-5)-methyltransferase 1